VFVIIGNGSDLKRLSRLGLQHHIEHIYK
jgi:hypothetical protein